MKRDYDVLVVYADAVTGDRDSQLVRVNASSDERARRAAEAEVRTGRPDRGTRVISTRVDTVVTDDRPPIGILVEATIAGNHVHVTVRSGQVGSRALVGELTFDREGWTIFAAMMNLAVGNTQAQPSLLDSLHIVVDRPVARPPIEVRYAK